MSDLADEVEVYLGPRTVLRVSYRDGRTEFVDGPAWLIGLALMTPGEDWASAKIQTMADGESMLDWLRSL